ncbi:MAG: DUF1963 domain-containing protein [candidate division Zixibacteria bacterium]|nr:DUF1963 domain-containing protein [candidate division Zixibacteria bacterium]
MKPQLDETLGRLIQKTVLMIREPVEADPGRTVSKFGGLPYMTHGEIWPVCMGCKSPLSFICQVDLGQTTPAVLPGGFFTFFYCRACAPWGAPDEQEGLWIVRFYPTSDLAAMGDTEIPETEETRCCRIRFETVSSLPSWRGLDRVSLEAKHIAKTIDPGDPQDAYDKAVERIVGARDAYSRLWGYPDWVQDDETPASGVFLAQIESEADADLMWGDAGCPYLFFVSPPLPPHTVKLIVQ